MDLDELVITWKRAVLGMTKSHDAEIASTYEVSVDSCINSLIGESIDTIHDFTTRLLISFKADSEVPFVIWRPFEMWLNKIKDNPRAGLSELKNAVMKEMQALDGQTQIPLGQALIRALHL